MAGVSLKPALFVNPSEKNRLRLVSDMFHLYKSTNDIFLRGLLMFNLR